MCVFSYRGINWPRSVETSPARVSARHRVRGQSAFPRQQSCCARWGVSTLRTCIRPVEEFDIGKIPPHRGQPVVVHVTPACHELYQSSKHLVKGCRDLCCGRGPLPCASLSATQIFHLVRYFFLGTSSNQHQRRRLYQTHHRSHILHTSLLCSFGCHRLNRQ